MEGLSLTLVAVDPLGLNSQSCCSGPCATYPGTSNAAWPNGKSADLLADTLGENRGPWESVAWHALPIPSGLQLPHLQNEDKFKVITKMTFMQKDQEGSQGRYSPLINRMSFLKIF